MLLGFSGAEALPPEITKDYSVNIPRSRAAPSPNNTNKLNVDRYLRKLNFEENKRCPAKPIGSDGQKQERRAALPGFYKSSGRAPRKKGLQNAPQSMRAENVGE